MTPRRTFSIEEQERILATHGYWCHYCKHGLSIDSSTIDHVVPLSAGGTHDFSNLVPACRSCNGSKGHNQAPKTRRDRRGNALRERDIRRAVRAAALLA